MPWKSGKAFASKHNKKLKGEAAETAKNQANALLKKGMPEGEAIAIANKSGDRVQSRHKKWYG
jgi:uncharacterized protein YdaT